jgi:5-methylcytosine-specific restriction endonuclease McrA
MNRRCPREPVPEIAQAAQYLDDAVMAHLAGVFDRAAEMIRLANMPVIREWTESLWGRNSPYARPITGVGAPRSLPKEQRVPVRMPNSGEKRYLYERDGYHCRFCGIPVIRKQVRERIKKRYPQALSWSRTTASQHAAFQALWLQYDHVVPHARGGSNDLENVVIACAPCNYGRWNRTVHELGLIDPRVHPPVRSAWDGLERFR